MNGLHTVEYETSIAMSKDNDVVTNAPYLRLHQNDKLRIPTYEAEMEPFIYTHKSNVMKYKQNTRNFKHTPHKLSCTL